MQAAQDRSRPPLRAIIFDVDGTLAETEETHREAFNRTFAEFGLSWNWDRALYRRLLKVSGGKERMRAYAEQADPDRIGDGFDAMAAAMHRRKTALYTAAVESGGVPFRPGVARLIEQARAAGLTLAVATTTSEANVIALFNAVTGGEGPGWFACIACAEQAPRKKPDPQVYDLVLERLGMPAESCVALEDSTNGVRAARAAGIPVIVTESIYTQGDDFTGALAVHPDLSSVTLEDIRALSWAR
ncbi:HAD-IA family hydrolase [Azospirillum sp. SYSU D00513]|uniref:HAD-IA family hydrolase n=1 Tax=Azospirillum sp. SYSU D00513 TaxID=2812561 RepID=UPI001A9589F2|nr:HAD-IA family hydrolase [Azospirillum sp. SYSU D00513]